jgi:predicted P-loop ATPase
MYRVIESDFVEAYHPFRYYLDHLPPWDGQDYLMELSLSVSVKGEVEEQMRFAQYLKKWLVGMVAAWVDDAVVNNVILVLIGEQGSYKTTWFHYLLPPELRQYFYTKTNSGRMGRDDLLTLAQYGLVCCEELDTMRPSELNQLKAAVTMPSVDERAAYAHYHEHRQHIASFCGTGNNVQFLSDPTGNRRWLPFEVESIDSPRDRPLNYEGIYAQAYALYREGFQYWFSREEIVALAGHNRQFETPRLEDELVQQYFRVPAKGEPGEFVSVALALQIVGCNITQKLSTVALGRAFVNQGFARKTCRNVRGYVVVRRSAEEMQSARRLMAHECNTDTDDTDVF